MPKKVCKFCEKLKQKKDFIFKNEHIVVMFGRPHHKGHTLVMPHKHEEHLLKLHDLTLEHFFLDAIMVIKALDKAIKADRYNIEYLDNWDSHIHWNIYPRFKKDKDWGGPPVIPRKGQNFKEQKLTKKELAIFKKGLAKITKELT